jgi:hypothetical protein
MYPTATNAPGPVYAKSILKKLRVLGTGIVLLISTKDLPFAYEIKL